MINLDLVSLIGRYQLPPVKLGLFQNTHADLYDDGSSGDEGSGTDEDNGSQHTDDESEPMDISDSEKGDTHVATGDTDTEDEHETSAHVVDYSQGHTLIYSRK